MGYTDPASVHNPASGLVPPASWGDTLNANDAFFYAAPSCRVYNTIVPVIPNNTLSAIAMNTERWDNDGIHNTVTNTSRLTAQTAGVYDIFAAVEWQNNTTGLREVGIWVNGGTLIAVQKETIGSGGDLMRAISTQWKLAVGDYVEVKVNQTSGGNLNITCSPARSPELGMTWVSAG